MSTGKSDGASVISDFFSDAFEVEDPESYVSDISIEREKYTKTNKTVAIKSEEIDENEYEPNDCELCQSQGETKSHQPPDFPSLDELLGQYSDEKYTEEYVTAHDVIGCTGCDNNGIVVCEACSGGEIDCQECGGSGEIFEKFSDCPTCAGKGYTDSKSCSTCNNSGSVVKQRQCYTCDGSGYNKGECHACNGTGTQDEDCPHCTDGSNTVQCDTCKGEGSIKTTESCSKCRGGEIKEEKQCPKCGGTETVAGEQCSNCYGSGIVEENRSCGNCNGRGEVTVNEPCQHCEGTGKDRTDCTHCDGTGNIKDTSECTTCTGSGTIDGTCEDCGGSGTRATEESCTMCDGLGEQRTECPECMGTKTIEVNRNQSCANCEGTGTVECPECDGTNSVKCGMCNGTEELHIVEMQTVTLELRELNPSYRPRMIPGGMEGLSWEFKDEKISTETEDRRLDEDVQKVKKETYDVTIPKITYNYEGETYEGFVTDSGVRYNDAPTLKSYDQGNKTADENNSSRGTRSAIIVALVVIAVIIWILL